MMTFDCEEELNKVKKIHPKAEYVLIKQTHVTCNIILVTHIFFKKKSTFRVNVSWVGIIISLKHVHIIIKPVVVPSTESQDMSKNIRDLYQARESDLVAILRYVWRVNCLYGTSALLFCYTCDGLIHYFATALHERHEKVQTAMSPSFCQYLHII